MSRGINRERQVRLLLEESDWWVSRAAGSHGDADLVALKKGRRPMLVEVKSTAGGPYERFGPQARERLRFAAAELAGAEAWLAWWPPRGQLTWIKSDAWPKRIEKAA